MLTDFTSWRYLVLVLRNRPLSFHCTIRNRTIVFETIGFCIFSLRYKLFFLYLYLEGKWRVTVSFSWGNLDFGRSMAGMRLIKEKEIPWKMRGNGKRNRGLDVAVPVRRNPFISFFGLWCKLLADALWKKKHWIRTKVWNW